MPKVVEKRRRRRRLDRIVKKNDVIGWKDY